ncbi:hypothetical protein J6590_067848, partial [Homalodisca vitripennis]
MRAGLELKVNTQFGVNDKRTDPRLFFCNVRSYLKLFDVISALQYPFRLLWTSGCDVGIA